jgi:hypothetical protein
MDRQPNALQSDKKRSVPAQKRGRRRLKNRFPVTPIEQLESRLALSGSGAWTPLTHLMPDGGSGTGNMILLSNGTVMVEGGGASAADDAKWYALTPDSSGNYVDATWSALASMKLARLDYSSVVLPGGDVMVLGGEYTGANLDQTETAETEIYNPVTNTWRVTAPVPSPQGYGDQSSEVLPNGTVLTSNGRNTSTYTYSPATNRWSSGPPRLFGDTSSEENWVKLPGGRILAVPASGSTLLTPQVFVPGNTPAHDAWVATAKLPAVLAYAPPGDFNEMGPALLLPNGDVWQIGGNNLTAIYAPPSAQHPAGVWTAGPSIPQPLAGKTLTGADAASVMLTNGEVMFDASRWLAAPSYFYLFNPNGNGGKGTITAISPPEANATPGGSLNVPGWYNYFLALPNGQVLFDERYTSRLWLYTPAGGPSKSWRPTVLSVKSMSSTTYLLTGKQLNGLSEGAMYGDDAEMSTNYPIVTLTAKRGKVYFARTFNWSNTSVATGTARVTTEFSLPPGLPRGTYALRAISNGIASEPFTMKVSPLVYGHRKMANTASDLRRPDPISASP